MKKYALLGTAALLVLITGLAIYRSNDQKDTAVNTEPKGRYVALGDSVSAGVGLEQDSDSSACGRTEQSYPQLVAAQNNYQLSNLSCSGATLLNGILGTQDVNKLLTKPQIDQLFSRPKPDLITVTIGANDAKWTTIFGQCYTGTCGSDGDTAAVQSSLELVKSDVQAMLARIAAEYGSAAPPVVVTGYHQVFPAAAPASCADLTNIDANELAWGRQLQSSIGDRLRLATQPYSFASFVAVDFSGHELCSDDSWVQSLNEKQPYHPTAAGQAAFAKAVTAAIQQQKVQ